MNLYIDCEWNDYRGKLISMALVAEDGQEFYEVLECPEPSEWIAKNVMPILGKPAVSLSIFRGKLRDFLARFDVVHVVADWPEDIEHFNHQLVVGPGERVGPNRWTMEVIRLPSDAAQSKVPHNALEDARAIAAYCANTRAPSGTVAVEPDYRAMAGRLAEAMQALVAHARGCEVLLKVPIQPTTEIALEALAEFEASKRAALADRGE